MTIFPACKGSNPDSTSGEASKTNIEAGSDPQSDPVLPEATLLLRHATDAAGGKAAIESLVSIHLESTVEIVNQGISGTAEVWWKQGDFLLEQKVGALGRLRAGKSGTTFWSEDPIFGLRRLSGAEARQHGWAASPVLAATWHQHFATAKTIAQRDLDATPVYDIRLTTKEGEELVLSLDASSHLPVAHRFQQESPTGAIPVEVRFDDFREVDGFWFPFKNTTKTDIATLIQETKTVEINPSVDSETFAFPTKGAEEVSQKELKKFDGITFDQDGKPGRPLPRAVPQGEQANRSPL